MEIRKKFLDKEVKRFKKELEKEISGIIGKDTFKDYKNFAFKKSVLELCIAFIVGAAFQQMVTALRSNILMPILSYILQFTNLNWRNIVCTPVEGLNLEIGQFAGSLLDFFIISLVLFFVYRKIQQIFHKHEITCYELKKCNKCKQDIHYLAVKCPYCTSEIK